jgi:uncharacterized protein YraI
VKHAVFAVILAFAVSNLCSVAHAQMGPDYWQVTGVASHDHFNIRTGPGASKRVVALAPNCATFRNLGCRGEGNSRWCNIETPDGSISG